MKISSSLPNFYNATTKINEDAEKVRSQKVQQMAGSTSSGSSDSSQQRQEYISDEKHKLIQTKVSPENLYQKTMLTDFSFAMERTAGKLMPHVGQILEDMKNLPNEIPQDNDEQDFKPHIQGHSSKFAMAGKSSEGVPPAAEKINIDI